MAEVIEHSDPPNAERYLDVKHRAYGEAAVMLLECLMLRLIERQILTAAETVALIEDAVATKRQMVEEGEHPEISKVAAGVLLGLANSLAAVKPGATG